MSRLSSWMVLLLFAPGAVQAAKPVDEMAILKQWAVARCVAKAYAREQVGRDANAAAGLLVEQSRVELMVFSAMDALVDAQLQQRAVVMTDKGQEPVPLLNCLELMHSKALDEMIRAYTTQQIG